MANNYMWLIHRPTKLGVVIGSRMEWGWRTPTEIYDNIDTLYRYLDEHPGEIGDQDDFVVVTEEESQGWACTWENEDKENRVLKFEWRPFGWEGPG